MTDEQILRDAVSRAIAALGTAAHAADNLAARGILCGKLASGNIRVQAQKLADLMQREQENQR